MSDDRDAPDEISEATYYKLQGLFEQQERLFQKQQDLAEYASELLPGISKADVADWMYTHQGLDKMLKRNEIDVVEPGEKKDNREKRGDD